MTADFASRVRALIADQLAEINPSFDKAKVTDDAQLIEDLGADSLDMIHLKLSLEEEFEVDLDHLDGLATVGDIITHLEGLTNGR